jgi:prepilin signal peptidase PulO-like enzyme (type II secretory pathway)
MLIRASWFRYRLILLIFSTFIMIRKPNLSAFAGTMLGAGIIQIINLYYSVKTGDVQTLTENVSDIPTRIQACLNQNSLIGIFNDPNGLTMASLADVDLLRDLPADRIQPPYVWPGIEHFTDPVTGYGIAYPLEGRTAELVLASATDANGNSTERLLKLEKCEYPLSGGLRRYFELGLHR